eukprot:TRINITY_DN39290_c0_g1_i1.p1 TRINITY_DN39290_c0_g1~~TRINITY_DN39290_c0_g1_i1.p1  ORF type:complete len:1135 (-),score=188.56 TRINITY_DN39290_c0_g1_i1:127-3045(-)
MSLPPQQTVQIYPPGGTTFNGLKDGKCIDEDPVLISRRFPVPLIAGVTRLPEWVSCQVVSPTELLLRNQEPILGGRPLIAGPVFELFIKNATNAQNTPMLNLFRVVAKTSSPLGREVWTAPGWTVFPELMRTSVVTSNPGYGLYTNFTITLQVITLVPQRGSILIKAPQDYYFGPVIETAATRYDPLVSMPPPQGAGEVRPPAGQTTICHILRPPDWQCPFDFASCLKKDYLEELKEIGVTLTMAQEAERVRVTKECAKWVARCEPGGQLSEIISCTSVGSDIVLELADSVTLPTMRTLKFLIQGYNSRIPPPDPSFNTWYFATRNSDSEKTRLDEKPRVPGVDLIGIIQLLSIVPSNAKVGSIENYVTITIRLDTPCDPRAILRITHPHDFTRGANAAFSGPAVSTGITFPRQIEKRQSLNVIELEAIEEVLPAKTNLVVTIGLSNPPITPRRAANIWTLEAFSLASGAKVRLNCNLNMTGFKIFGEMGQAFVTGTVLSPNAQNIIGVWFSLKSQLTYNMQNPNSQMKIWFPPGFRLLRNCGGDLFRLNYNPNREGIKNQFPNTVKYYPLPSGTDCFDRFDDKSGQAYALLTVDGLLDYGLDYAFEFAVTNPDKTPPTEQNIYRFETLQSNVILHLRTEIKGFELEQIKICQVSPSDTTTLLPLNKIEFYMMSDKYITGGSKIRIYAPSGYIFTCAFFSTDAGLATTTTCYVREPTLAEFTLDTADPKDPNSPFRLFVYASNPEFTPQENYWNFKIISPLGISIDVRDGVSSFDITGRMQASINPTFPYLGQTNPVRVVFVQSTILNQADIGNEFVLTGPEGYIFPENCTDGFNLQMSNAIDIPVSDDGYDTGFVFPPPGMTCTGYGNASVTIRFPDGAGLLRNNYTLQVDVVNPGYHPNASIWTFISRVRNKDGERIVDANRTLQGFALDELKPMRTDESAASRISPASMSKMLLLVLVAATCAASLSSA